MPGSGSDSDPSHPPHKTLHRTQGQLKRNAACHECRRRRVKCDAARPTCQSCIRSYHFLSRTYPDAERDAKGVQCHYGDEDHNTDRQEPIIPPRPPKRKAGTAKGEAEQKIKMLEDKVAQLQKALEQASPSKSPSVTIENTSSPRQPQTAAKESALPTNRPAPLWSEAQGTTPFPASANSTTWSINTAPANPYDLSQSFPDPQHFSVLKPADGRGSVKHRLDHFEQSLDPPPADAEAGRLGPAVLDMLWPGWPPTLPTPSMVDHLAETFFKFVPSISRVINRQSFFARLSLPPTHSEFPQRALIHAICAVAARYTAAVSVRSVADGMKIVTEEAKRANGRGAETDLSMETCFAERNAGYAMEFMKYNHMSARGIFDILQAMATHSRWMEGWVLMGGATRLVIGLGLLEHTPQSPHFSPAISRSILGPPRSDAEREERRAAAYYVMMYDTTQSASSGWAGTMPTSEMSARMPSSKADFERGGAIPENFQSFHSRDLFYNHPIVDSFVLLVKGHVLLHRTCQFIRRCRAMDPDERELLRDGPDFRQLDGDIAMLSMSFPQALREPVQYMSGYAKGVDADLISAHLIPRITAIYLHEPFAHLDDPNSVSATRVLTEARACLNIVYLVISSNADISFTVTPITSLYLFTASRALLLFYQRALETGDSAEATTIHGEISVFKMAFTSLSTRFAMGVRHLILLEKMMEHIEEDVLGQVVTNPDFSALFCRPSRAFPNGITDVDSATGQIPGIRGQDEIPGFASLGGEAVFPETHPDGMIAIELDRSAAQGRSKAGRNVLQAMLDHKRNYVGPSSRSTSGSGSQPGSGGPSPSDAYRWLDKQQGMGQVPMQGQGQGQGMGAGYHPGPAQVYVQQPHMCTASSTGSDMMYVQSQSSMQGQGRFTMLSPEQVDGGSGHSSNSTGPHS
ncbi:hypothetical protein I350_04952 [Cryptococcus amylolentus CBS 6273]|uniref:Zn(2)-C6 fungal-type domain-containing protein n=1 Tax=Cryptococcus amylolentus CBS 6273 TaxID=1296118 RepID=A0A1E3JYM8_9TREE|nr:hypothetical protein I350_04952 [Cryptococcus amylolentus CBS 6273]